ncbi:MAG TPA: A/G-specific adenine glycosylase, partial [Anaerolineales bacterium]
YAVWVAEIMAQQTRLESMLPYHRRWMKRFPTIEELANSKEQDVLSLWEGLGYYSRARNLRRSAQLIMKQHNGRLPDDVGSLLALPGIGRYTAGAIASMAFAKDEPAVDGNAVRVLSRVFNVKDPVGSNRATKRFWALAAKHLPKGRAADYNQALMDLGASICRPRQPDCSACPLRRNCHSFALGVQGMRPVRQPAKSVPTKHFAAAVIQRRGRVLVLKRPVKGLLGGMWGFPNVVASNPRGAKRALRRGLRKMLDLDLPSVKKVGQFEHTYSHFNANLQVYGVDSNGRHFKIMFGHMHAWKPVSRLDELPMGKLDRQIARSLRDNAKNA